MNEIDPPEISDSPRPSGGHRTLFEPTREIRFAVVLFGGVSLAVYISGVVQELLHLVRASAPDPRKKKVEGRTYALLDDGEGLQPLSGTEKVYRELALRACGGEEEGAAIRTRFVIDVISGTSAGGINGIFLAKALADGLDLGDLAKLWEEEAELDKLLHDRHSYEGLRRLSRKPPASLLNSRRMTWKLLEAFDRMEKGRNSHSSPLVDQLDLLVTATDLRGKLVRLRVGDSKTYELHHKRCFHFSAAARGTGKPGFGRELDPFLAFAARATSSFPLAFEPATLDEIEEVCRASEYFADLPFDENLAEIAVPSLNFGEGENVSDVLSEAELAAIKGVPFGDGGFLDNKPFTNVLEHIRGRQCSLPVERKLIYVEPAPEHPEENRRLGKLDAFETAYLGVMDLPRRETIREDLQKMKDYNEIVRRAEVAKDGVEQDTSRNSRDPEKYRFEYEQWRHKDLSAMIKNFGIGYGSFMRLRVAAATDAIARFLAGSWGWSPDSEVAEALLWVARAWRGRHYAIYSAEKKEQPLLTVEIFAKELHLSRPVKELGQETENAYLADFEHGWLLRRLRFVADQLVGRCSSGPEVLIFLKRLPEYDPPADFSFPNGFLRELRAKAEEIAGKLASLERSMDAKVAELKHLKDPAFEQINLETLAARLAKIAGPHTLPLRPEDRQEAAELLLDDPFCGPQIEAAIARLKEKLVALLGEVRSKAVEVVRLSGEKVSFDDSLLGDPQLLAESMAAYFYRHFEQYDLISYPLLYGTGGKEGAAVDILRISPEDADSLFDQRHLRKEKLAGSGMAHFAAFCDRRWRRDDRVWGRLDAAERIVAALVPEDELRRSWLKRLQSEIVQEELGGEAAEVVGKVLREAGRAKPHQPDSRGIQAAWDRWVHQRIVRHDRLSGWIHGLPQKVREEAVQHLMAQIDPTRLGDVFAAQTEHREALSPDRKLDLMRRSAGVLTDLLAAVPDQGAGRWAGKLAIVARWLTASLTAVFVLAAAKSPFALGVRRLFLALMGLCGAATLVLLATGQKPMAVYPFVALVALLAFQLLVYAVARLLSGRMSAAFFRLALGLLFMLLVLYGGYRLWGDLQDWLRRSEPQERGSVPSSLAMIPSITSSAPAPIESRRQSRKARATGDSHM